MKWSRIFALCLSLCSSVWLSALPESSSSTDSPPAASAPTLQPPNATWDQLDEIWTQLEQSGQSSSIDSAQLRTALDQARQQLTQLSSQLADSRTQASALSSSLAQADLSLQASGQSLKAAQALASRQRLDAALWRFGSLSGVLGASGSLLDPAKAQGAAIGAGIGAAIALAWTIFDPPWK